MTEERFYEICRDMALDDRITKHMWEHHRPPEHLSEAQVRDAIPSIIAAHELLAVLDSAMPKIPAA